MGNTFFFAWEISLMEALQSIASPIVIALSDIYSFLGQSETMVAVIAIYYLGYDKKLGLQIGLNSIFATVTNTLIKNVVCRRRPYFDHDSIECLVPVDKEYDAYDLKAQGWSFPSAHSTNSTIIPGTIYTYTKSKIALIITIFFGLGVGISRAIVGCHYPTDILVGWLQAIIMLIVMPIIYAKVPKKYLYPTLILISSVGLFYCTSNDYFSIYGLLYGLIACDIFDSKVTHFKNTNNLIKIILRVAFSAAIFLGLNTVLKLPFSTEFLENGTLLAGLVRTIRYFIASFAGFGLCPLIYKYNILKLEDKNKQDNK